METDLAESKTGTRPKVGFSERAGVSIREEMRFEGLQGMATCPVCFEACVRLYRSITGTRSAKPSGSTAGSRHSVSPDGLFFCGRWVCNACLDEMGLLRRCSNWRCD